MDRTLMNPNQLRHFCTKVQDNTMSDHQLYIITVDNELWMEIFMDGTIEYADNNLPKDKQLHSCPHIIILSYHPLNSHNVDFHKINFTLYGDIGELCYMSEVVITTVFDQERYDDSLFNLNRNI